MTHANGTTALAVVPSAPVTATASTQLEPSTVEQAFWLAGQLVKSGLLGKSVTKAEAAFAVILTGRELGLTAMQSLRSIHCVDGKPTLSADLMAALVKRSPYCVYFRMVESTAKIATYSTERVGEGVTTMSFTIDDAVAAGIAGKAVWKQYTSAMLRARCIAVLARVVFPDVMAGIYEADSGEIESSMPSTRGDHADANIAPVIVRPAPSEPESPSVDDTYEESSVNEVDDSADVVALWSARFDAVTTPDELKELHAEVKREVRADNVLMKISKSYVAARARITGGK
jgi:hypothetical protein